MKKIPHSLLAVSLALIPVADAAVTISTVGSGSGYSATGAEVTGYYTTSVAKTFDEISDNKYGTDGYYIFGGTNANNGAEYNTAGAFVSSTPSFVSAFSADEAVTLTRRNASQASIDDPTAAINGDNFGNSGYLMNNATAGTTGQPMMSFSVSTLVTTYFRLGIIAGSEEATDGRYDPTALALFFDDNDALTTDPSASFTALPVVGAGDAGIVFFDIILDAGTTGTFSITADERSNNPTINGITFDLIPEPSSSMMLLGGAGLLVLRRRRV
ncbi:PEP-CTERM sorting domain-containing protein [Luteolibacter sp. AS25]|uniref:PEP-CTERM sorting domain-containing protein n=1 Tax=Luteolibacter sp. AS25 TaxID=3135776 RepID=UPI00398B5D01